MTVTKTVGVGKDYTNIANAWNSLPSTLSEPYIIEVYTGTYNETKELLNKTTTAINNITIKAADELQTISIGSSLTLINDYVTLDGLGVMTFNNLQPNYSGNHLIMRRCKLSESYLNIRGNDQHDLLFENCVFIRTGNDFTFYVDSGGTTGMTNMQIINCTFKSGGIRYPIWFNGSSPVSGIVIRNNIFYNINSGTTANLISLNKGNATVSDNIYYAPNASSLGWRYLSTVYTSYAAWASASGETGGSYQDPKLTDVSLDDFRLISDSPAIDQGYDTGLVIDFVGTVRDVIDIGAYEYYQSETPGAPLLCWQLTGRYYNGRMYSQNGSGPYPKELFIPKSVDRNSLTLVDEGLLIDRKNYFVFDA